jgi:hypothetical protein
MYDRVVAYITRGDRLLVFRLTCTPSGKPLVDTLQARPPSRSVLRMLRLWVRGL